VVTNCLPAPASARGTDSCGPQAPLINDQSMTRTQASVAAWTRLIGEPKSSPLDPAVRPSPRRLSGAPQSDSASLSPQPLQVPVMRGWFEQRLEEGGRIRKRFISGREPELSQRLERSAWQGVFRDGIPARTGPTGTLLLDAQAGHPTLGPLRFSTPTAIRSSARSIVTDLLTSSSDAG